MHKLSFLAPPSGFLAEIVLPASKSIHNRVLIFQSFLEGFLIENESTANDCILMKNALSAFSHGAKEINVGDAGTVLRFLLPRLVVANWKGVIDGSERMRKRPIKSLVDALIGLGADISFVNDEGSLPLRLNGFAHNGNHRVDLKQVESSQFISGLLLVAPYISLNEDFSISYPSTIGSLSYIDITLKLMQYFGAELSIIQNNHSFEVSVKPKPYIPKPIFIEPDWSAVGYFLHANFYAKCNLVFKDLVWENSLQGDAGILEYFKQSEEGGVSEYDFSQMPDQAQTFVPFLVSKEQEAIISGLESLNKKESLRANNLSSDLKAFGYNFLPLQSNSENTIVDEIGVYELKRLVQLPVNILDSNKEVFQLSTRHDHRVAMGMAPLAAIRPFMIDDISVVSKSFPSFWDELRKLGYTLEQV